MAKRFAGETILARWTIAEGLWREFLEAKARLDREPNGPYRTFLAPQPFPAAGLEVVIREDAIFVGRVRLREFHFGALRHVSLRESYLQIQGIILPEDAWDEDRHYLYLLPVCSTALPQARLAVERLISHDKALSDRIAAEDETSKWSQPLLRWVEQRFVWILLAFFFGVIPLAVFLLSWGFG
jgi:hypothetical protein